GFVLPRRLQVEFSPLVQAVAERTGKELSPADIRGVFEAEYLTRAEPYEVVDYRTLPDRKLRGRRNITATVRFNGIEQEISGHGNGPVDAFLDALREHSGRDIRLVEYNEHAIGHGADAAAAAYIEIAVNGGGALFGVGTDTNIVMASLRAITSAVNRAIGKG
ncbi:MAG: alpha-isopropylmalate synthase regulatory domain-containing protein, partial [Alphaproteobacteria bacterium]